LFTQEYESPPIETGPRKPPHPYPRVESNYPKKVVNPPATTTYTLDRLLLTQPRLRHATYTCCIEVILLCLDTSQTTQLLISLFLPFRDQICIGVAVLEEPVVECFRDGFFVIVEVVDVP